MRKLVVVLLMFGAIGCFGCGARVEVAKERVLAQVDRLLGEIQVKKKEAEIVVRNLSTGLDNLKRAKIEAKLRLAQARDKRSEIASKAERADLALGRLRDQLQNSQAVSLNGQAYSPMQMKGMADRTIALRKRLDREAKSTDSFIQRQEGFVTAYEQREAAGRERLAALQQQLMEIDADSDALKALEEANALAGVAATLDFESVEKKVRELSNKIQAELTFHDEKWQESLADNQSLDQILSDTSDVQDTVAEIDGLVGKK